MRIKSSNSGFDYEYKCLQETSKGDNRFRYDRKEIWIINFETAIALPHKHIKLQGEDSLLFFTTNKSRNN
ncbi:MAG: hypothetical protein ACJAUQ_001978 [Maribacter sp.]|jgi:hypothetical protein